jgi:hypothetical protein
MSGIRLGWVLVDTTVMLSSMLETNVIYHNVVENIFFRWNSKKFGSNSWKVVKFQ